MINNEHPKLRQLREFIAGRTVCFQIPGPSITQLSEHLNVIPKDVVWMGHNFFRSTERITEKIGKRLDLVYVSCVQTIKAQSETYREFLERGDDNLLLITTGALETFEEKEPGILKRFSKKIIIARCEPGSPKSKRAFEVVQFPGPWFSFVFATLTIMKAGANRIVFFGLDGGLLEGYSQWYYGAAEDYPRGWFRPEPSGYTSEVDFVNREWASIVKAAKLDKSEFCIYNCSPRSRIECFERISYEDLPRVFGGVLKGRKENDKIGIGGGSVSHGT